MASACLLRTSAPMTLSAGRPAHSWTGRALFNIIKQYNTPNLTLSFDIDGVHYIHLDLGHYPLPYQCSVLSVEPIQIQRVSMPAAAPLPSSDQSLVSYPLTSRRHCRCRIYRPIFEGSRFHLLKNDVARHRKWKQRSYFCWWHFYLCSRICFPALL